MANSIVYQAGTYRSVTPEATWERVAPMLPRFGITRVADITGLDDIGLPVHVAYRPDGLSYAVSIGTGPTPAQSRVSAVMESIEAWHAENLRVPVSARCAGVALELDYDVRDLNLSSRSPLTANVVLDWVTGQGLLTGRDTFAPVDLIRLDLTSPYRWPQAMFHVTSNGLATGNTVADAVLHGLVEVIERDSVVSYVARPPHERRYVDLATCRDPAALRMLEALRAADCTVLVCDITGRVGLPCYAALVWSPDVPFSCGGYGCHVDRGIAIGRALSEAVQTRLALISGARDDLDADCYRETARPPEPSFLAPLPDEPGWAGGAGWAGGGDLDAMIRHCAALAATVTGAEPFAVPISHPDVGIPAVKVIAPGLRMMNYESLGSMWS
jgi:ribosomal protein S12 methylthiotransferase accessory factor